MTTSKLRQLEHIVTSIDNLDEAKKNLIDEVKQLNLPHKDQMKLLMNIATCTSVVAFQQLFYNSLLKYEGLGVI